MQKHSTNKRKTDAKLLKLKQTFSYGGVVLTFLERISHNALPKNRKRETRDACMTVDSSSLLIIFHSVVF